MSVTPMRFTFPVVLFLANVAHAQTVDPAAVVSGVYPARLVELAERSGVPADRRQCFAVYDTRADGRPSTIIAAYTNGVTGAVRVLRESSPGAFGVVAEPVDLDFHGHQCEVEVIDFDHDGRSDIHISFSSNMNSVHWAFLWDGQNLTNVTPVTSGSVGSGWGSDFANGDFMDLDLDGRLEFVMRSVVGSEDGGVATGPDLVFALSGAAFVETAPVVGVFVFERRSGAPQEDRFNFPLPSGAGGPFSVEILNGDAGGASRVSSASVSLNGSEIAVPRDFSQKQVRFQRSVELQASNQLVARLQGKPGSRITVIVRSEAWSR